MHITKVSAYRLTRYVLSGIPPFFTFWIVFLYMDATGAHYMISSAVAFVCYWIVNFVFIRYVAFRSEGELRKEMLQHVTLHLSNQFLTFAGLHVLIAYYHMNTTFAQAIMNCIYILINVYVSHRIFDEDFMKKIPPS